MENANTMAGEYNSRIDRIQLYKPFVTYTIIVTAMNVAAYRAGREPAAMTAAFLLLGLLSWGFFEYVAHRWVLHRTPAKQGFRWPGNLTHLRHHADPQSLERLNVQLSESIPVSLAYCALAWAITGSWHRMTLLFTGLIAGYFFYEYLDFQAHHGTSSNRFVQYFRNYHLLHHFYSARVRYGVTSPVFDYIFGTFHVPVRVRSTRNGGI